ncbi:hypothetical protein M9H77_12300 [Catharanthus roseus]|uniref:Uncharacterized protein n=1 Tax=Catharanthus roseus TaxID=4058 RepID=A0ACC0BH45_CATRO|nr:hypothetical protein M9H77_12300 [Catharanthus roseus]
MFVWMRKRLASGVLPDRPTGRKSTIKRTELDRNPRESEMRQFLTALRGDRWQDYHLGKEVLKIKGIPGKKYKSNPCEEQKKDCRIHVQRNPKYLNRYSTHAVNVVVKRLDDKQRKAIVRMGFRSMLELRTCSLPYDIFSWMADQYNSKKGLQKMCTVYWGYQMAGRILKVYFCERGRSANKRLENEFNLMIGEDKMMSIISLKTSLLNLRTAGTEFQVKFILLVTANISIPIGEKVSPYRKRRTPRIIDWSQTAINQRARMLRELRLFRGIDVDMVEALGPKKDAAELEALRSRLDSFGAGIIEVKSELKSLRGNVNQIKHNVELSQSKMMEELHKFMTFINEKYRECGGIQIDCEQKKKTRSEILPTKTRGIFQKIGKKMCSHWLMTGRMPRTEATKDFEKSVVNVAVLKMIDL